MTRIGRGFILGHVGGLTRVAALRLSRPVCAGVLLAALLVTGMTGSTRALGLTPVPGPGGSTVSQPIAYCPGVDPGGGMGDLMTLYTPAGAQPGQRFPALIFVHGGGWETGNASSGGPLLGIDGYALEVATALLGTGGFEVADIDYRLANPAMNPPANQFPAQIIDIKCAIRYLRANSPGDHVDGSHILAMGSSAGGHLVSLAGTAPPSAGFECQGGDTTDWCSQSSAVQAVVDEWGVSDFTDSTWTVHASQVIDQVFGHSPGVDNPLLERASPVTYIASGDPPFLIIQGDDDPLNTPTQATELTQRLSQAGIPSTLYLVHHAAHGALEPGEQPGITQLIQTIVSFVENEAAS